MAKTHDYEDFILFTSAMKKNLEKHAEEGDIWRKESFGYLVTRLLDEYYEVFDVIFDPDWPDTKIDYEELMKEAADVGNFAMFIFNNARKKLDEEKGGDK